MRKYIFGNAKQANESVKKGWIAGHMHSGVAQTSFVEVKQWHYDVPFDYGQRIFQGTELITIYGGALRFELEFSDGQKSEVFLNGETHDYIILPPDTKKRVIVEQAPAYGDTVRWPSAPSMSQAIR